MARFLRLVQFGSENGLVIIYTLLQACSPTILTMLSDIGGLFLFSCRDGNMGLFLKIQFTSLLFVCASHSELFRYLWLASLVLQLSTVGVLFLLLLL